MGNEIPNINKEIHWMNDHSRHINKGEGKPKKKVVQNRILRYYIKKINNYLYRLLYEG